MYLSCFILCYWTFDLAGNSNQFFLTECYMEKNFRYSYLHTLTKYNKTIVMTIGARLIVLSSVEYVPKSKDLEQLWEKITLKLPDLCSESKKYWAILLSPRFLWCEKKKWSRLRIADGVRYLFASHMYCRRNQHNVYFSIFRKNHFSTRYSFI